MRPLRGRSLSIAVIIFVATSIFFVVLWIEPNHQLTVLTLTKNSDTVIPLSVPSCESEDPDLIDSAGPLFAPQENSIFFHETSCRQTGSERHLNPRQACAVESAARLHPDRQVYVLFSSIQNYSGYRIIERLLEYTNVKFASLRLEGYASGTPIQDWLETGQLYESPYRTSHTSDVLRFLTLWKYGGVYLDLDVVVARPLDDLGANWAGFEAKPNKAGSSVISFSRDETGRRFTDAALRELTTNFRGDIWEYNGPELVTRVMQSLCSDHNMPEMNSEERCQGMKMYPPNYFYPIPYKNWKQYFEPSGLRRIMEVDNITYVYHVWNKLSNSFKMDSTLLTPYTYLAQLNCPKVYGDSMDNFYSLDH